MAKRLRALSVLRAALLTTAALALPPTAWSAEPQVGMVAMLLGTATVTRTALPAPVPLSFKDDVFLRDRITTAEKSAVRVLLGGKATVTARELSVLTITEVPGTSTVSLAAGRTAVAVSKGRMKPGETVEIKTPNVVVAVRGTFVIAEVSPGRSTITILRGLVEVTKLDPTTGRPVGPAVKVGALERVIVTGAGPVPAPQAITPEAAKSLVSDFTFLPKDTPAASMAALNEAVKKASMSAATNTVNSVAPSASGTLSGGATGTGGLSALTQGIGTAARPTTTPTDESIPIPISPTVAPGGSVPSLLNPTVTQPVSPAVTQPINSPVTLPIDPAVTQPISPAVTLPVNPAVTPPISSPVTQPINPAVTPPINPAVTLPVNPAVTQPINPGVTLPVSPTVTQPASPAVTQPVNNLLPVRRSP